MMNTEVKAKWIEALRSGKYEKGWGKLRTDDNLYCCLGVLCSLVEGVRLEPSGWAYFLEDNNGALGSNTHLPDGLKEHLSIPSEAQENLIAMNDGNDPYNRAHSFSEIADWIEANL